jgi:hypothetical protein
VNPIAAFQGERGAFSEEAARKVLGSGIDVLPCRSFEDVFAAVADGRATCAVIPIENSLAGSVLRNYELLAGGDLSIEGETYLRIELALIAERGVRLTEVREVRSHPVALAQCHRFIAQHGLQAVPAYDTAGSVKEVLESGRKDAAAIAGAWAADFCSRRNGIRSSSPAMARARRPCFSGRRIAPALSSAPWQFLRCAISTSARSSRAPSKDGRGSIRSTSISPAMPPSRMLRGPSRTCRRCVRQCASSGRIRPESHERRCAARLRLRRHDAKRQGSAPR